MINHANGEITNPFFLKSGTRWEFYSCYSAVLGDYFVPGTVPVTLEQLFVPAEMRRLAHREVKKLPQHHRAIISQHLHSATSEFTSDHTVFSVV